MAYCCCVVGVCSHMSVLCCCYGCVAVLQREGFAEFVEENVVSLSSDDDEASYLRLALGHIFNSFDREGDGCVDTAEFAAAFTLLADGSKSDKLVESFALFDGNNVGRLSKLAMWKFFRSLLTMIGSIVSITHELTDENLSQAAVDRGAIEITTVCVLIVDLSTLA